MIPISTITILSNKKDPYQRLIIFLVRMKRPPLKRIIEVDHSLRGELHLAPGMPATGIIWNREIMYLSIELEELYLLRK